ncbi:galactose-binding domain-like protein [Lineolata rhizophorae]|uniref:allantoicase n=1 Tax=Lineolata rhizophorae TaxID=578093 RepID=A0A6A6NZJ4_9PEZI|nr:galactose-binding domain-like protein [Lineolata rhizophorae]
MEVPAVPPEAVQEGLTGVRQIPAEDIDATFKSNTIDLVSKPLGSRIVSLSDEWFASASNLTTPTPPVRKPGVFTHAGAWYDGWETRRHNRAPFDFVIFRLGVASGRVHGVEVDTAFFNGNHAPEVSVEGCALGADDDDDEARLGAPDFPAWEPVLPRQECGPSRRHAWLLPPRPAAPAYTHVRLAMYPDGGIARFRLYGLAEPVFPAAADAVLDLAAAVNGGVAAACSDQHFGAKDNLLLPGRGVDMGDGWETKRTRGPHVDWVVVKLGAPGEVVKVVVDTAHFRGNFPQKVAVFAGRWAEGVLPGSEDKGWVEVLEPMETGPDREHEYGADVLKNVKGETYSHLKLVIIPDGGVKRFRVFGRRRV